MDCRTYDARMVAEAFIFRDEERMCLWLSSRLEYEDKQNDYPRYGQKECHRSNLVKTVLALGWTHLIFEHFHLDLEKDRTKASNGGTSFIEPGTSFVELSKNAV